MAWVFLLMAGMCEIIWAVGLKMSHGFSRLWPSLWSIVTMLLSFYLLSLAMKRLPLGTSYTVWTGIGAAGTVIFGMIWLGESRSLMRIGCIGLILLGIVGLKWLGGDAGSAL